jgi:hypothetical protein
MIEGESGDPGWRRRLRKVGLNQVVEGDDADSDDADEPNENELDEDFVGSLPESGDATPPRGISEGQAFRQRVVEALLNRQQDRA